MILFKIKNQGKSAKKFKEIKKKEGKNYRKFIKSKNRLCI